MLRWAEFLTCDIFETELSIGVLDASIGGLTRGAEFEPLQIYRLGRTSR